MMNVLRELSTEEVKNFKELGTATGTFEVCLHMANKHVPDFQNRVIGYRIEGGGAAEIVSNVFENARLDKEESINVTFYEK